MLGTSGKAKVTLNINLLPLPPLLVAAVGAHPHRLMMLLLVVLQQTLALAGDCARYVCSRLSLLLFPSRKIEEQDR